ncbi:hypothetical protein [Limnoglobus roseus]|uniref:Uncharacterized protein n=1 Tax=Limnoglobus roseus TaxID=2598579 RepID=A0A5C1AT97_9BACT|nr:hypothetical protein [Limnoglobus roseus]QEL20068.1 hypothetical protein PX52LOC_07154 [Limnoglobus roseus]
MPTFLSDPSLSLYGLLAVVFIVALAVWYRRRDRKSLIAAGVTGLLLFGLCLIDLTFESPREEATRRVQTMAVAASAATLDPARFVEQLSPTFQHNGGNREKVRTSGVWGLIRQHNARAVVWGFGKSEFEQIGENEIEIGFYCKAEATGFPGPGVWYAKGRFIRDPDGQFRAKGIKFINIQDRSDATIPGFP